ncbi:MAG: hypothetical protein M1368_08610 [Thaumarchaeota archaeon]|nr:hypothetical protein [Nitrososphaerota archaeon]
MASRDSDTVLKRLRLLGLEVIVGSIFLLVLVIYIWASNAGSSWENLFLWMAIISVVMSITGVQILHDIRQLPPRK